MIGHLKIFVAIVFFVLTQKISAHKNPALGEKKVPALEAKKLLKQVNLLHAQELWIESPKTKRKATEYGALRLNLFDMRQPVFFADCRSKKTTEAKFSFKETLQSKRGPPLA